MMTDAPKSSARLVEPATLKGFQDLFPEEMIRRNHVMENIRRVFEKYGFLPMDTPVLEYLTTLIGTGGEAINKELFRLKSPEGESIAMRFDLTVPFSRIVAQYPEKIKLPFRRYHAGPVFRADKPDAGRFRQFTQFDIDIAGSDSVAVDAEIVAAMCDALRSLGLRGDGQDYRVRINNRKIMDALLQGCGISEDRTQKHVLRVVDKLQKIGVQNVRKELGEGRVDDSGDPIDGVGLESAVIERILLFISIQSPSRRGVLDLAASALPGSELSEIALAEMRDLADALQSLGVTEEEAVFDPSLARGLDYYTGPIFETILPTAPQFGAIMGGGRFDHLVGRFLDTKIPATGASIGVDRLVACLTAIGKLELPRTTTKAFLVVMDGVPVPALLAAATELRNAGVPTEIYLGAPKTAMRDQLSYANAKEIPIAVIIGPDELAEGKASVKDLAAGKEKRAGIENREQYRKAGKTGQMTIDRAALAQSVLDILARQESRS